MKQNIKNRTSKLLDRLKLEQQFMASSKDLLTSAEAAVFLGISHLDVLRHLQNLTIPFAETLEWIRFSKKDLMDWFTK